MPCRFPGILPAGAVNLAGRAVTPRPSIVINFRFRSTGFEQPLLWVVIVVEGRYQQGQGSHGGLSRVETASLLRSDPNPRC